MNLSIPPQPKFLIIRRDNIGDLVCTTPLIRKLREKFPNARIDALVNSYNEPVLENNPDVDGVFAYTKAKHRPAGKTVLGVYWDRLKLLYQLRARRYDFAIIASTHFLPKPLTLARQVRPRQIVGFVEGKHPAECHVDIPVPYVKDRPMHLVEELAALLAPFDITGPMPSMQVVPDASNVSSARVQLEKKGWRAEHPTLAVHISARKVPQRWPEENFVSLMRAMQQTNHDLQFVLFWSPGEANNPLHPGDDQKAARILASGSDLPLFPFSTGTLKELIAGLSLCDQVLCSDGGAMHVAAALGKPIVCFFGNSDASVWYPWGVSHQVLQKPSRDVNDITTDEAVEALKALVLAQGSS
ncbi:MAG TPA: glycosyltransferase family 9 protein [Rhodocyclaceae bacterium]|jgi:ADP-heptose:LPS heptosyltransferase